VVLALQWAKWVLGGILFVATFFIVRSTVQLAILAQKDEIEVMQLIGAPEELIQAPFVVEGMIQGFIGAGLRREGGFCCYSFVIKHRLQSVFLEV
jgi:cell division transport system permease protein